MASIPTRNDHFHSTKHAYSRDIMAKVGINWRTHVSALHMYIQINITRPEYNTYGACKPRLRTQFSLAGGSSRLHKRVTVVSKYSTEYLKSPSIRIPHIPFQTGSTTVCNLLCAHTFGNCLTLRRHSFTTSSPWLSFISPALSSHLYKAPPISSSPSSPKTVAASSASLSLSLSISLRALSEA